MTLSPILLVYSPTSMWISESEKDVSFSQNLIPKVEAGFTSFLSWEFQS